MRELGYAEVSGGEVPDRTGQVWFSRGVRWLIVGAPRLVSTGPFVDEQVVLPLHPAIVLELGTETTLSEASLLGCRREA